MRVEPLLIVTLELVIQHHANDVRALRLQTRRFALVRAIDLEVVFELPLAFDAVPEGLIVILVTIAMAFEKALACVRQRDSVLTRAGHTHRLDQALLT